MFSCGFYELFRNTYFIVKDLRTAGSDTHVRGSPFNKSSVNFVKIFGKVFRRTSPSNHFLHDIVVVGFFSYFLQISEVRNLKSIL